jgi:phosphatidate cytidylyltransferase
MQLKSIAKENVVLVGFFPSNKITSMLRQRLIIIFFLIPLWIYVIFEGELLLAIVMICALTLGVWEYRRIFRIGGYTPADFALVASAIGFTTLRAWIGLEWDLVLLVVLVLSSMSYHLISYERGREQASIDFLVTIGGIVYIGLFGSYFVVLRNLSNGAWWLLVVLTGVWLSDSGGYIIGKWLGQRKLAPRLSPQKTREGYIGGIVFGTLLTPLFVLLYQHLGLSPDSAITLNRALVIGIIMSVFTTLGDLGISMFKRTYGVKDSGTILPGHGGILDRIDSWLWGVLIGYYLITLFFYH